MTYPSDLRYTREHEWVRVEGDEATIGITQYAAEHLGDIVFVEAPAPGTQLRQFSPCGVVESVKAVSDLFAPLSGEVLETNPALTEHPEALNSDPYGDGWLARVRVASEEEFRELLDAAAYEVLVTAG